MFNLSPSVRIFVSTRPVDMRRGFNGLLGLVQESFKQDPYSGHLFLFHGQRCNLVKILWWDIDGVCIFSKRLSKGTFNFPEVRFENGQYAAVELKRRDLMMLLEGLDFASAKPRKRYERNCRDQSTKVPQKPTPGRRPKGKTPHREDSSKTPHET